MEAFPHRSVTPARIAAALTVASIVASACGIRPAAPEGQSSPAARSTIRAADGTPIARLFTENRAPVEPRAIPRVLKDAIVAAEDANFWEHAGLDAGAIARAAAATLDGRLQGGSTITQQLAKMLSGASERTLGAKIAEAVLAVELERRHTKDEILAMYLNTAYFGARAYGVAAAAETYLGVPLRRLTLAEAALIAGLVRAPSHLDPFRHPEAARERRSYVLRRMAEERMITQRQARRADRTPIRLRSTPADVIHAPWFVGWIERRILTDPAFGATAEEREAALYGGGLDVHTTLDLRMQRAAERAVARVLDRPGDPEAALVALDPRTGAVKAMVGGRDARLGMFNLATQARRQPGSTFKPLVLVAAMEQGIPPQARFPSRPETLRLGPGGRDAWRVDNYDGRDRGPLSLHEGMVWSVNGVYARLGLDVGPDHVIDVARRLGIAARLDRYPSIALGATPTGVSPLEMASAYGTFAAIGRRAEPHGIRSARDRDGAMLLDARETSALPAIDRGIAVTMNRILGDAVRRGTGASAWLGRPMAGKTGTTDDHADAWFVGYTPELVVAVWVGYRHRRVPMLDVHGIRVTGSSFPAAIWRRFMLEALDGAPHRSFAEPPHALVDVRVDTGRWCVPEEGGDLIEVPPIVAPTRPCPAPPPPEPSPAPSPSVTASPGAQPDQAA